MGAGSRLPGMGAGEAQGRSASAGWPSAPPCCIAFSTKHCSQTLLPTALPPTLHPTLLPTALPPGCAGDWWAQRLRRQAGQHLLHQVCGGDVRRQAGAALQAGLLQEHEQEGGAADQVRGAAGLRRGGWTLVDGCLWAGGLLKGRWQRRWEGAAAGGGRQPLWVLGGGRGRRWAGRQAAAPPILPFPRSPPAATARPTRTGRASPSTPTWSALAWPSWRRRRWS